MGSIGTPELVVLGVLALLIFGPKRLPEIGRNVGAMIREFRKASRDLMAHFEDEAPVRARSYQPYHYDADITPRESPAATDNGSPAGPERKA